MIQDQWEGEIERDRAVMSSEKQSEDEEILKCSSAAVAFYAMRRT